MKTVHLMAVCMIFVAMSGTGCAAEGAPAAGAEPLIKSIDQKLPPIMTVTVGRNRELLVNGKPFIPFKVWLQDPVHFPKLRAAGVNVCMGYWWNEETKRGQGDTRSMDEYARAVGDAGFYYIAPYMENQLDATRKVAAMDHLLAWIHNDEPDLPKTITDPETGKKRSVPRDTVEQTAARYRKVKALDAKHPVLMGLTANFMRSETRHYDQATKDKLYPQYVKHCDGVGFDTYPIFGWNRPDWLCKVGDGVSELGRYAGPDRLLSCTVETCKGSRWVSQENQLDVEPRHTRAEVWMALIRGATMISYFTHSWRPEPYTQFACTPEMVRELRRLNGQITRLTCAIVADPAKVKIEMHLRRPDSAAASRGDLACHFKATQLGAHTYIFAQNLDMNPGKDDRGRATIHPRTGNATFTVEGMKAGTKIEVVDEDRTITGSGGKFADEFAGLAEHIYRFRL